MNKNISDIHSTLDTVKRLKRVVTEAVAREEEIEKDYRIECARAKREFDERTADIDADHETQLAGAKSALHHSTKKKEANYQRRQQWIENSAANAHRLITDAVEGQKGNRISQVQAQTLKAKRQFEADLSSCRKSIASLEDKLLECKKLYRKLHSLALACFRGFPILYLKVKNSAKNKQSTDLTAALTTEEFATSIEYEAPFKFEKLLSVLNEQLSEFSQRPLPKIFRYIPLQFWIPIGAAITISTGYLSDWNSLQTQVTGGVSLGLTLLLVIVQRLAASTARRAAADISETLKMAGAVYFQYTETSQPWMNSRREQLEKCLDDELKMLNRNLGADIKSAEQLGQESPTKVTDQEARLKQKNSTLLQSAMDRLKLEHSSTVANIHERTKTRQAQADDDFQASITQSETKQKEAWQRLETQWHAETPAILKIIADDNETTRNIFPDWTQELITNWQAPDHFFHAAGFGHLDLDLKSLTGRLPSDNRLRLPVDTQIKTPLTLCFPSAGSILFETESSGDPEIINTINNILLRLLSVSPAGKLNFSIFDPVGLGQNFAGITHLADYEDSIINERIWTQREQIENRISELNAHMEKVIQMYLRNEYDSITEYNKQAGNIAEKYHFLVIADFPGNFSEAATRGLLSIAASGARCGIYTLIHWDKRQPLPEAFDADDLRKTSITITGNKNHPLQFPEQITPGSSLHLYAPPADELATKFVHHVGRASSDSNRVEVPFSQIMPKEDELWKGDTTEELRIAIGRTGATKLQELAIGKGTRQHALFAGKTGSGKSTLFHVMITNLALSCSPDEVEFYLIDFKKGVEFKCYGSRKLPHARVVAIESDREFGLSVLQRLDEELKRRGELFRDEGVQDLSAYRNSGKRTMPRTLLIIDEFQEFFVEDDRIAQNASVLLDRIVRQGRAFGIHVLLGSQTLGGAYSLARATLGQMVIRVALQCNEADAYLIMDESNPAPRLLTRPGEGIYNDSAGAIGGNSPFQTVWLPEQERDSHLDRVSDLAARHTSKFSPPIVFEGNAPADIRENVLLANLLITKPAPQPDSPKVWLGAPNAIKGPTEAVFHRQSGNHMLIVGQRDDAIAALMVSSLLALGGQFTKDKIDIVVIDANPPGSPERDLIEGMLEKLPHPVRSAKDRDITELIGEVSQQLQLRGEEQSSGHYPPMFVLINGLQRFKKLRYDDDLAYSFDTSSESSNPALQLNDIICEGAAHGIHLITSIDSYNNIGRTLSRKALSEFEMRILFQMSSNDSAALVDSSKGATLGMHRALFYNEHEGYLETFRPYALPEQQWLSEACEKIR